MDTSRRGAAFWCSCWRTVPKALGALAELRKRKLSFWEGESSLSPELSPASHRGCAAQLVARRDSACKGPWGRRQAGCSPPGPSCQQPVGFLFGSELARTAGINFSTLCAKLPPSLPPTPSPRSPAVASAAPSPRAGDKDALGSAHDERSSRKRVTVMQKLQPGPRTRLLPRSHRANGRYRGQDYSSQRPREPGTAPGRPRHGVESGPAAAAGEPGGPAGDRRLHRP